MLRLSHYRLVSRIGAGGMGEVYLAVDERLGRKVPVKVLFASDESSANRDLASTWEGPLSLAPGPRPYDSFHFSPDGKRVALVAEGHIILVVDRATSALATRFDAGPDTVIELGYLGDRLVVGRGFWDGDVWIADVVRD